MNYLELPYRLQTVKPQGFANQAQEAGRLKAAYSLADTLTLLLGNEEESLAEQVQAQGAVVQAAYGTGGGDYCLALGIGVSTLRIANPLEVVSAINLQDWVSVINRERELRSRFAVRTVEDVAQLALDEIGEVNEGFVDGFLATFDRLELASGLAFSALGVVYAHDLVHFASIRE